MLSSHLYRYPSEDRPTLSATGPQHSTADMACADTHHRPYSDSIEVRFEMAAKANVCFVRMYLQCAVLVSVNLHVAVTVSVQWCEHDAEGSSPMTEEHEQTVSQ